jgi:hypothetical protein
MQRRQWWPLGRRAPTLVAVLLIAAACVPGTASPAPSAPGTAPASAPASNPPTVGASQPPAGTIVWTDHKYQTPAGQTDETVTVTINLAVSASSPGSFTDNGSTWNLTGSGSETGCAVSYSGSGAFTSPAYLAMSGSMTAGAQVILYAQIAGTQHRCDSGDVPFGPGLWCPHSAGGGTQLVGTVSADGQRISFDCQDSTTKSAPPFTDHEDVTVSGSLSIGSS